jgi:hypothetical protein
MYTYVGPIFKPNQLYCHVDVYEVPVKNVTYFSSRYRNINYKITFEITIVRCVRPVIKN